MIGRGRLRLRERPLHPARIVLYGFASAIAIGTALLSMPVASADGRSPHLVDALFTATSAVTVTGLITVDTGSYWSAAGQAIILLLIQFGAIGIMTMATLFAVLVTKRMGLSTRMAIQVETQSVGARDVRHAIRRVVLFALVTEAAIALVLFARYLTAYDRRVGPAAWDAAFHAISSFGNAGFSLNDNSMMDYVADPWVIVPVAAGIIIGGLGFPVIFELVRSWRRPAAWSVLTRITLWVTIPLLVLGTVVFTALEWSNEKTMAPLSDPAKVLSGFFHSAMTRSGGFNSIDTGAMREDSWLVSDALMFIGGGSASTAAGIKVTTFGVLIMVVISELRGQRHVNVGNRRLSEVPQRQALAIVLAGIALVVVTTFAMLAMTGHSLDQVLFEATSAIGTVGLSTGITDEVGRPAQVLMSAMMYIGRVGPLALFAVMALREVGRRYELPEERPMIG